MAQVVVTTNHTRIALAATTVSVICGSYIARQPQGDAHSRREGRRAKTRRRMRERKEGLRHRKRVRSRHAINSGASFLPPLPDAAPPTPHAKQAVFETAVRRG